MKAIPKRISAWRSAPVAIFVAAIMIVLVGVAVIIQSDNAYRDARRDFAISQAQILAASAAAGPPRPLILTRDGRSAPPKSS